VNRVVVLRVLIVAGEGWCEEVDGPVWTERVAPQQQLVKLLLRTRCTIWTSKE
jgi:hypothetical protein